MSGACGSTSATRWARLNDRARVTKIPFHCQLADLAVERIDLLLGLLSGFTGTLALEDAGGVVQQFAFPLTHHSGVDLEAGRDLRRGLFSLRAARATLALNSPLYCRRFLLMIKLSWSV